MTENNKHLQHLSEIRALMERSTRFLSLSGLSGVWAGLCALAGVAVVYSFLEMSPFSTEGKFFYYEKAINTNKWGMDYKSVFLLIAIMVLAAALAGGWYFTARKARLRGERIWDATSRRLLVALAIPLFTGGVFCLALLFRGYVSLLAPCTLIFYGLALINGSKYTLDLLQGKKIEGDATEGDLVVRFNRASTIQPGSAFDWSCAIEALNGGVMETTDEFMFLAPESGYQPSIRLEFRAAESGWASQVRKQFYIKSRGGGLFGRIDAEIIADYTDRSVLNLRYAVNPAGSRVLEPE